MTIEVEQGRAMARQIFFHGLFDEEEEGRRSLRRQRVFRDRLNPLEQYSEQQLHQRYRFNSNGIRYLVELLEEDLSHPTKRNHAVPVVLQICTALRFFACGSFIQVVGDCSNLSKATVCSIVKRVSEALRARMSHYIKYPTAVNEIAKIRREIQNIAHMPGIIGCIDCTHVRIIAPSEYENDYVNRKGYHSINCQFVCQANGLFINAVIKHPGCAHDSRIFQESTLGQRLETGDRKGILLGDSGYPCRRYILTPLLNPQTIAERNFNTAHSKTRTRIEQAFGIFKRRFYGLHCELRVKPEKACLLISACAVLHNIAILQHQSNEFDEPEFADENINFDEPAYQQIQDRADGQRFRRHYISTHFY